MQSNSTTGVITSSPLWLPCKALWAREVVRFLRQRSRISGALGTPLLFWFVAGSIMGTSVAAPGSAADAATQAVTADSTVKNAEVSYLAFTFPGALAAVVLFTSIFASISIIDDRRAGFMQGVLVSPAAPSAIVMGKILGAATLAVGQALLFLPLGLAAGIPFTALSLPAVCGAMVVVGFAVNAMGFWVAWRCETSQGFHSIMMLIFMPMLFLSGAFAPVDQSSAWVQWITTVNPITYCVALIRGAMNLASDSAVSAPVTAPTALAVTAAFGLVMFALALAAVRRDTAQALQ